jgi:Ca-activated chloride channel homolog
MEAFHFLRPWWLMALLPAALILFNFVRLRDPINRWRGIVAPHLLPHLLIRHGDRRHGGPLVLLGIVWALCTIALAGPTWRREPTPFADDTAALVILLKVTPSMRIADIQPDRLARSVQKIRDLLARRPGAKAALIAYSGSAHIVVPLTNDSGIINTFAEPLDPAIMPIEGDACVEAIQMAKKILADAKQAGSILWITDGVSPDAQKALTDASPQLPALRILAPLTAGAALDSVKHTTKAVHGDVLEMTPDDSDVNRLARDAQFSDVSDDAAGGQWHESGYALLPIIALATMFWFRRGVLGTCANEGGRS